MPNGARALLVVLFLWSIAAVPAAAQPPADRGFSLAGSTGAALGSDGSAWTFGTAVGFRLSRRVAIEAEVVGIPALDRLQIDVPLAGLPLVGSLLPITISHRVRVITAMLNTRVTARRAGGRLRPFLVGGLGLAALDDRVRIEGGGGLVTGLVIDFGYPSAALVAGLGGGVDVGVGRGLFVGGEARLFNTFLEGGDLRFVRVAARVGCEF